VQTRGFLGRYLTLFGGEVVGKLCVLGAFAFLAHVLTPSDYGTVELALFVTVFFVLGVESGMGLYGARVVAANPERAPRLIPQVMLLRAILGLPAYILVLAVASHYRTAGLGILAVNGLAVLLTPFLTQWVFQGLRQMQWVAAGSALRNLVFVALILLLVRAGSDLRLVAAAEVAGIAALAMFNTWILHRRLQLRLDWRELVSGTRRLFGDVWYMGLSDFTWACLWYSPALIVGWLGDGRSEQVAWIAVAVRIVMALHTFVWLYFFNLLPDLARELSSGLEAWRSLVQRSLSTSMWPACLIAVGGTLIAPWLVPFIYGQSYEAAILPLQISVWMIPIAWFSGHFRFSLIAAGQQRWEFAASAMTAVVTVIAAYGLGKGLGAVGAAEALVAGGVVNTAIAVIFAARQIGTVGILAPIRAVVASSLVSLAIGFGVTSVAGPVAGATAGCLALTGLALRFDATMIGAVRGWLQR
jgi:PST family polysaccharide transporter